MKSLMSYVLTKKEKDRSSRYHRSGRCNCNGAGKVSKDQIHAG